MAKLFFIFLILITSLTSCNQNLKTSDSQVNTSVDDSMQLKLSTKEETNNSNIDGDFSQNIECVKYIQKYKDWIKRFIRIKLETKNNPNDSIALVNFKKLEQEGKALGDPNDFCAGNRGFQDSLLKITEYAAKALNE